MLLADVAPLLSHRLLHLILMPTEQCNFRCVYCYEDFSRGEMTRPVVGAVKALLARRIGELDLLSIAWFGGEPMLAWPIVEEIQGFAWALGREHPEVRCLGSMTTNGSLLTRPKLERLIELGVRTYQISLDGPADFHDATRRRRGGGGSFAGIWKNLLAMSGVAAPFEVLLRLHVSRDNLPAMGLLLERLARELAGDTRFAVTFKAIRRFGGPNDPQLPVLSRQEEGGVLERLVARAAVLGLTCRQDVFARPGMLPGCYAAALGSYVVRSSGELAKCTVALNHPNNRIGVLKADGTVTLDPSKMSGWLRGAFHGQPESIQCPKRGWADGGGHPAGTGLVQIGGTA